MQENANPRRLAMRAAIEMDHSTDELTTGTLAI
jgi:hypothetical protein